MPLPFDPMEKVVGVPVILNVLECQICKIIQIITEDEDRELVENPRAHCGRRMLMREPPPPSP